MTGDAMRVWMAMEADTGRTPDRVLMQDRPIEPTEIPLGVEGDGWAFREGEVDDDTWAAQLAGELSDDEIDAFHQDAWARAAP